MQPAPTFSSILYYNLIMVRQFLALLRAIRIFWVVAWRVIRQLFHETTGAIFLLFALTGTLSAVRLWRRGTSVWPLAISVLFALLMAGFALTSFRAARRVR